MRLRPTARRAALARRAGRLLLVLSLLSPFAVAGAQSSVAALDRAIEAYRTLDLDLAAERLAALTADSAASGLDDGARVRGLMYLGATEVLRERHEAAAAAFRRLLLLDPAYRPDEFVFPPEVTSRFDEARRTVRVVAAITPDSVELAEPGDAFPVRLHASSPHVVRVMVLDRTGTPVRLLHDGEVGDSLELRWSGRDAFGRFQPSGTYRVEVSSAADLAGRPRVIVVPLRLERVEGDTIPLASLPAFVARPETRAGALSMRPLLVGLLGVAAVAALPSAVGGGSGGLSSRYVVAGGFIGGAIAGVALSRRARPIPENVAWNARQRAAHERELARVRAANEARRGEVRLRILAQPARVEERP